MNTTRSKRGWGREGVCGTHHFEHVVLKIGAYYKRVRHPCQGVGVLLCAWFTHQKERPKIPQQQPRVHHYSWVVRNAHRRINKNMFRHFVYDSNNYHKKTILDLIRISTHCFEFSRAFVRNPELYPPGSVFRHLPCPTG
jgi:hypothetical protein